MESLELDERCGLPQNGGTGWTYGFLQNAESHHQDTSHGNRNTDYYIYNVLNFIPALPVLTAPRLYLRVDFPFMVFLIPWLCVGTEKQQVMKFSIVDLHRCGVNVHYHDSS